MQNMKLTLHMKLCYFLLFVFSMHQVTGGSDCPNACACKGYNINCSHRRLTVIPKKLPHTVIRLNFYSNRITRVTRQDFNSTLRLKILQLHKNLISTIEFGSFDALVDLERLRLDHNRLRSLPIGLFRHSPLLRRLDVSHNRLRIIEAGLVNNSRHLQNLQMNYNGIVCIAENALDGLDRLEILNLRYNNISSVPENSFRRMVSLRNLRLAENNLLCDCHLAWLRSWLAANKALGKSTKCARPIRLRGKRVADVHSDEFQCSTDDPPRYSSDCRQLLLPGSSCPLGCSCSSLKITCNRMGLKEIPERISSGLQQLELKYNLISRIRSSSTRHLKQLRRLDLTGNRISQIDPDAFQGLRQLHYLSLKANQLRDLPAALFRDLDVLQVAYLSENRISCVPVDAFANKSRLTLLYLNANEIKSMAKGTLPDGPVLQQVSLSNNPFVCDCNLRWLSRRLRRIPDTGATCVGPTRVARQQLQDLEPRQLRCQGNEADLTRNAGNCELFRECPVGCRCRDTTVDCGGAGLNKLPDNLPLETRTLLLHKNRICNVTANSILSKLTQLETLDLSHNLIDAIEPGAFAANSQLLTLNLSNNRLPDLQARTLKGLDRLTILQMSGNLVTCLNNDTFLGTPEISMLSISQNRIRCMMEGTFAPLKKLAGLHIDLNPLHCNCHMHWLPEFIINNYNLMRHAQPACGSPELLMDTPVVSLRSEHFMCNRDGRLGCHGVAPCCTADAVSCDLRAFCPSECECEGTKVQCIGKNLTEIPDMIPADTTHLFLSQNRIDRLNATRLKHLRKLLLLDISHNQLTGLRAGTFRHFTRLESLLISSNRLACIEAGAFSGLKSLTVLILQGNQIVSLPFGLFDELTELTVIGLTQNPIHCDCNVKWLIDFFHKRNLDRGMAVCSSPASLAHASIFHSRPEDFQCSGNAPHQPQCNACSSSPCSNGAKCVSTSYESYRCECKHGFIGDTCQLKIDACYGAPCNNNATCEILGMGRYRCLCRPGFAGDFCETNVDDCVDHKCQNNATCIDGVNSYRCRCRTGFRGRHCEEKINYCKQHNPCQNGATCVRVGDTGYSCQCPVGWQGANCETNVNDCDRPGLCRNGGSCIDAVGTFRCRCRPGYSGSRCETLDMPGLLKDLPNIVNRGVCTYHECLNGGRCEQTDKEYRCICTAGYEGKKCEKLTQVGFYSDSHAELNGWRVFPHANVTLVLATKQQHGMVLYVGDASAYIVISLFKGFVRLSYSLGVQPGATAYSHGVVNDGEFHTIESVVSGHNLSLKVDSSVKKISAVAPDNGDSIRLAGGVFVGGLPAEKRRQVQSNANIREAFSFGGCVKQMFVNEKPVNFKQNSVSSHRLIEGCPAFSQPPDPCKNQPVCRGRNKKKCRKRALCKNKGKCISRPDLPEGFECKCKARYSGKRCEQSWCNRIVRQSRYFDAASGCHSRRQIRIRSCQGRCPRRRGYCCSPRRYRRRRVQFVCNDGRTFHKTLQLVRRCGCKPCGGHNSAGGRRRWPFN